MEGSDFGEKENAKKNASRILQFIVALLHVFLSLAVDRSLCSPLALLVFEILHVDTRNATTHIIREPSKQSAHSFPLIQQAFAVDLWARIANWVSLRNCEFSLYVLILTSIRHQTTFLCVVVISYDNWPR